MNYQQMTYNNKNYVVNWPDISYSILFNDDLNASNNNSPIQLSGSYPVRAPDGVVSYNYDMPLNNRRSVPFTVFGTPTPISINFTITGIDYVEPSTVITETITLTAFDTPVFTSHMFSKIISIVPINIPTNYTFQIGYGGGQTLPFVADVFNKVSNFSAAFSNMDSMSAQLEYSLDGITYFPFNMTQPPFSVSPSGFANPITEDGIVSFKNVPLQFITATVPNTEEGSFTLTIMQQGARF